MKAILILTLSIGIFAREPDTSDQNKQVFDEYMMVKDHIKKERKSAKAKAYIFNKKVKKRNYTKFNLKAEYVDAY